MKKINKSSPPNALTEFAERDTQADWNCFYNNSASYKAIKQLMLQDQGGLCGYCERKIINLPENKQRIEHFHAKSDQSAPNKNWALDWNNVLAVCIGGDDADKQVHPLPSNLSCDSHKNHLINKGKLVSACEGHLLNPLHIPTTACLFGLDKATGALNVNIANCQQLAGVGHSYGSLETLVETTIEILNLNCQRLKDDRLEVLKSYNQEVAKARKANDKRGLEKLVCRWFRKRWPSYFTTRRIILGKHAETFLHDVGYNG